jgi:aspartyl-tRNA(Asn)/glutamyl-tRNA(Gln) amidotransferase subunit A
MSEAMTAASTDLCALGVTELGRKYRSGEISPVEVTSAVLDRIERLNAELNVYVTVMTDSAMAAARAAEQYFRAGVDLGPMHGVPFSVKDIIRVQGTRTSAASRVLHDAPADGEDATVVRRLRAAGAILLGKVNLHEFAFGDPDPDGPFGLVQNPRKLGHQCGGSSSGSGAATAAGLGVISLGTDTGGSIRHPASVCGVVGLKPTYGLVPMPGIIPLSVHFDHVGPLGRSVADVAAGLTAIAGWDPDDPYCSREHGADYMRALEADVRGLRLGSATNAEFRFGMPEALGLIDNAHRTLIDSGLRAVEFELERVLEVTDVLRTIMLPTDLWSYHEQFRDREALYGRNFLQRALPGREISALQYINAKEVQAAVKREWRRLFERMNVVMLPANVAGALPHGTNTYRLDGKSYPLRRLTSAYHPLSSITGFPALVVPVGQTSDGLPIAVQLIAPPLSEKRLLAVGALLERALGGLVAQWGIEPRH